MMEEYLSECEQICEIGRRLYERCFVAANDGNLSIRVNGDYVLCTPTMHSKGFLRPEDLVLIDMNGERVAGSQRASSEALLHLTIYQNRPEARAVVHCHPPHATAFAITHEVIPQGVLPEVEVFLGEVPMARFETPGTQAFANTVIPFLHDAKAIILSNHGTVSFDQDLEKAFWWTEILESYCRILLLSKQLGELQYLSTSEQQEVLAAKQLWNMRDRREVPSDGNGLQHQSLFQTHDQARGLGRRAFGTKINNPTESGQEANVEAEVRLSTSQLDVLASLIAQKLRER